MLLAIFGHVNAYQCIFIVEHEPGKCLGQFGFTYTRGTDKDERTDRACRILQAGPRAADGIGDGVDRLLLADNAIVQTCFHVQELFRLAFHHLGKRDACPLVNDRGDIVHIHHLVELVFGFPFVTLAVVFLFQPQALGFLLGGQFVVTVQAGLFLLGV